MEVLIFLGLLMMGQYLNFYILSNLMFLLSLFFLFNLSWIEWTFIVGNMGINYYSFYLILMMFWIFGIIFLNLKEYKKYCLNLHLLLLLFMLMNFLSMNLIMFYFMYEVSLLLIFYMIMKWGYSEDRLLVSFYLLFYTLVFSLPMLYLIFKLYEYECSLYFFMLELMYLKLDCFNFLYMIMSFLVKVPIYMFHGWLIKAHVEAPFFSSMILASVMLKLGGYGMLRMIFMFKFKFKIIYNYLMIINIFGMLVLSLMCLFQFDMKLIIAFSSVVHMGIMLMGLLSMSNLGILGGLLMMISHGLVSSGLFYLVHMIYNQTNNRLMFINKGLINVMPSMSMMWFMLCVYNSGAPISLNMISEIFLLMSLICWCKFMFLGLMLYCLFSFMYSIYLFSFMQYGVLYEVKIELFNCYLMNYLTLILHLIPLNLIIMKLFF
nr:TPA_asm: ND4 [Bombus trifasciatus]